MVKGAVEFDTMAMSCRRTSAICENPNHPIGCAPAICENPNHPIGRALTICENPNHPISAKTSLWWRFPQRARTATLLRSLPLVDCSLPHGQLSLSAIYIELHWMKAGFLLGTDWAYQSRYTVLGRASRETVVWMNRLKRYLVLSWQITNILRNFNSIFILTLANGILLTFKTTVWNHLKVKGAFLHSKEDMPKCRLHPWCGLYCHPHFPFLGNARCFSRVYLPGALVLHHSGSTALDIWTQIDSLFQFVFLKTNTAIAISTQRLSVGFPGHQQTHECLGFESSPSGSWRNSSANLEWCILQRAHTTQEMTKPQWTALISSPLLIRPSHHFTQGLMKKLS